MAQYRDQKLPDTAKIESLIRNSGISFRQNSRSYILTCPRCMKKDKLYIRKSDGQFVCWVCKETENFKGRPEYVLTELLGQGLREIKALLYGDADLEQVPIGSIEINLIDFFDDDDDDVEDVDPAQALVTVPWPFDFYTIDDPRSIRGLTYLEQERGISKALALEYGLRYCPPRRRVIFPVEVGGRLVGWQARSIIPTDFVDEEGTLFSTPKILGNTGLKREVVVMFGDRLRGSRHAVICEGPVDAIKCHLCGGNVATMGKAISQTQVQAIRRAGVERVYLALDPDAAEEMSRLTQILGDLELYQLLPDPGHKDLGEMSPEAVLNRFRQAPRIIPGQVFLYLNH